MFEKDKYCKDGKPNREVPKADFEKDTEPYKDYTWWSLGLLGLAILATLACAAFTWPLTVPIIAIVVFAITSVVLHSKGKSHTEGVDKANKDRTAFNEEFNKALQLEQVREKQVSEEKAETKKMEEAMKTVRNEGWHINNGYAGAHTYGVARDRIHTLLNEHSLVKEVGDKNMASVRNTLAGAYLIGAHGTPQRSWNVGFTTDEKIATISIDGRDIYNRGL